MYVYTIQEACQKGQIRLRVGIDMKVPTYIPLFFVLESL